MTETQPEAPPFSEEQLAWLQNHLPKDPVVVTSDPTTGSGVPDPTGAANTAVTNATATLPLPSGSGMHNCNLLARQIKN